MRKAKGSSKGAVCNVVMFMFVLCVAHRLSFIVFIFIFQQHNEMKIKNQFLTSTTILFLLTIHNIILPSGVESLAYFDTNATMGRRSDGKHKQKDEAADAVEDASRSNEDSSQSASASSTSSSSEDSPKPSGVTDNNEAKSPKPKTWDSMDGYEVRQNAIKLLNASPDANNETNQEGGERKMNSITYQSYQDLPYSNDSTMDRSQASPYASTGQPNWGDSRYNANDPDENLNMYHIASLTFNCMVHCLTEGYRAASTYYNSSYPQDTAASSSTMNGFQSSSFQNSGSYQDSSYNGIGGGGGGGQSQYKEVMDRDTTPLATSEVSRNGEAGTYQSEQPQGGGWGTTVKVPSTYQGKK